MIFLPVLISRSDDGAWGEWGMEGSFEVVSLGVGRWLLASRRRRTVKVSNFQVASITAVCNCKGKVEREFTLLR